MDEKVVQHPDSIEEVLLIGGPYHGERWDVPVGEMQLKIPFPLGTPDPSGDIEMQDLLYVRQVLQLPTTDEAVELFVHATC